MFKRRDGGRRPRSELGKCSESVHSIDGGGVVAFMG